VTVLAALVAAGSAMGAGGKLKQFSAMFEYGGTISFELKKSRDGRKVRLISIDDIAADCEGQRGELEFVIKGSTPVLENRKFAVRSESTTGGEAVVKGKFSPKFKRAEGTARVSGEFFFKEGPATCDSGKQEFAAKVTD
jgi:hypothetical protein